VVTEELEWDDVQQALQTVHSFGDTNGLGVFGDTLVTFIAYNDGLGFAGSDLGKGGLNLRVERVASHDDDDWHVFVNQSERAVFQFTGKDA
jgi:hypothetical protein